MTNDVTPNPRPRKKGIGKLGCLGILGALVAFAWGMELFWTRLDERRFPWMYPRAGRSTLVGTWVGTLTSGGGQRRGVMLVIEREPINFGSRRGRRRSGGSSRVFRRAFGDKLDGSATLCGAPQQQHFTLNGGNETMDASRFRLSFYPSDSVPPNGLAPSFMRGAWDLRDALELEVDLYLRDGNAAVSNTDDPDTGRMGRAQLTRGDSTAFGALCARMAPRRSKD